MTPLQVKCRGYTAAQAAFWWRTPCATAKANKSADLEGYSLYSAGGITIRGEHTRVQSDDGMGIVAEGGILKIEGGSIDVSSTDVSSAWLGWCAGYGRHGEGALCAEQRHFGP